MEKIPPNDKFRIQLCTSHHVPINELCCEPACKFRLICPSCKTEHEETHRTILTDVITSFEIFKRINSYTNKFEKIVGPKVPYVIWNVNQILDDFMANVQQSINSLKLEISQRIRDEPYAKWKHQMGAMMSKLNEFFNSHMSNTLLLDEYLKLHFDAEKELEILLPLSCNQEAFRSYFDSKLNFYLIESTKHEVLDKLSKLTNILLEEPPVTFDVPLLETLGNIETGHQGLWYSLEYICDYDWIATGGSEGIIKLWDANNLNLVMSLPVKHAEIGRLKYLKSKKLLMSCDDFGAVRFFKMDEPQHLYNEVIAHSSGTYALKYVKKYDVLLTGGNDSTPYHKVKVWNLNTLTQSFEFPDQDVWVCSLNYVESQDVVISAGSKGIINMYSYATKSKIKQFSTENVYQIWPTKYLKKLNQYCLAVGGVFQYWTVNNTDTQLKYCINNLGNYIKSFEVFEKQDLLILAIGDQWLRFYKLSTGEEIQKQYLSDYWFKSMIYSKTKDKFYIFHHSNKSLSIFGIKKDE